MGRFCSLETGGHKVVRERIYTRGKKGIGGKEQSGQKEGKVYAVIGGEKRWILNK